jgi:hypothetical protein
MGAIGSGDISLDEIRFFEAGNEMNDLKTICLDLFILSFSSLIYEFSRIFLKDF